MTHGMIVAAQPEAAEAGATILRRGGNAVDAAIACAFSQGVVDPQMAGIAGYGAMHVWLPKRGFHQVFEFLARAPLAVTPDMWAEKLRERTSDGDYFLLDDRQSEIGHRAVATPGSLKGYAVALAECGTMDLKDVMAPAIEQARHGFRVRPYVYYHWTIDPGAHGLVKLEDRLRFSATGRALYFRADGTLKRPGERICNPDLALTLERIAAGGIGLFYGGEIGEEIVADMQANGGYLSLEDLRTYEVTTTPPLCGEYRGHSIAASPLPLGGVQLIELLHIVDGFDLSQREHNDVTHLLQLIEAMKRVAIDRQVHLGDPDFVPVPIEQLTSKDYARRLARRIVEGERVSVEACLPVEPPDTTQVCVIDEFGNAVSLTHTLGSASGVITPGLGFMHNGTLASFDPRPGRPGSLAPGKRRTSSMTPTIVFTDDRPSLIVGAPGGMYIAPALAQSIINVIDFGMPMFEAVAAPRIAALTDTVEISNRIPNYVSDELVRAGYHVNRSYQSYAFAAVHGIAIEDGRWSGGADPQRDGVTLRV